MFGEELFIRFTAPVYREDLSVFVCVSFPFGFEGRVWDLIVLAPDHCLSFFLLSFDIQSTLNIYNAISKFLVLVSLSILSLRFS